MSRPVRLVTSVERGITIEPAELRRLPDEVVLGELQFAALDRAL